MINRNYEFFSKKQDGNIYNKYLITLVKGSIFNKKDLKNNSNYIDKNDLYKVSKKYI